MQIKRRGVLGLLGLGMPAAAQLTNRTSDQLPGGGLINPETKPQPSSVEESAFPKWEYKLLHFVYELNVTEQRMNQLGVLGWEYAGLSGNSTYIFKRRISSITHLVSTFDVDSDGANANCGTDALHIAINNGHLIRNAISSIVDHTH